MFNYGYSILEGICLKAINQANLYPYIGFVHEIRYNKSPLVYDLMEPFRWLVDKTIIEGLEHKLFNKKDFIRTDDYIIRLRPEGVKKLMNELDRTLSQTATYRGLTQQWGNIIQLKAQELSNYLQGKTIGIDITKPILKLERVDSQVLRKKILNLTYTEWKNMGFSKGTFHYMKQNAKANKPFTLNKHVEERLNTLSD